MHCTRYDEEFQRQLIKLYDAWRPNHDHPKKKKKTKQTVQSDSDGEVSKYGDELMSHSRAGGVPDKDLWDLREQSGPTSYKEMSSEGEDDDGESE